MGIDDAEIGEFAYDYVELTRDVIQADTFDNSSKYSGDRDVTSAMAEKLAREEEAAIAAASSTAGRTE